MRTFAQKQNQPQKPISSSVARPNMATHPILHLQRAVGNQAVQRTLQTNAEELEARLTGTQSPRFGHDFSKIPIRPPSAGAIQTKLAINKPGDEYEQEADRVSEQVMRMPEPKLQRTCACGGECPKCQTEQPSQEEEHLHTKRLGTGDWGQTEVPPIVHDVLRSSGQRLDPATRAFMEPRFGLDFNRVRVHTDAKAADSARAVHALAYTVGNDVVFGTGQYAPGSSEGRRLLAHELSHVVQQTELQTPRVQRQYSPIIFPGVLKPTNYRFETFQITESDLSDPEITARLQGLSKDQLRHYLDRVTDPAVRSYILELLAAPEHPQLRKCTVEDCLEQNASFERVSRIVTREIGPTFDVFDCYGALAAAAAKGRPSLTPEAGCAQCITTCSDMELSEALKTCRDTLLNHCIDLTASWQRFVRRPF
jgi:hypothetical protein